LFLGALLFVFAVPAASHAAVLYSQNTPLAGGTVLTSHDSLYNPDDDELADDFVVPDGQEWMVQSVHATGYYDPQRPATFNVMFYSDASGGALPQTTPLITRSAQAYSSSAAAGELGDFKISLGTPARLNPGHYWVSVQAVENSAGTGWWWNNRFPQAGSPAAYRNTGGAPGTCHAWTAKSSCGSQNPDLLFQLDGTSRTASVIINQVGAASPYPSTRPVSGLSGPVTDVNVTLTGLTHSFPDDIDALLVGPQGQKALLMSDVGTDLDVNEINLTLDDASPVALPNVEQLVTGIYRPTEFDNANDTFPSPAPAGPYANPPQLSVFNGTNPNGFWSLYLDDDNGSDYGAIAEWSLSITTDAAKHVLSAVKTGNGSGSIASTPAGIGCGNVCSAGFETNSSVTLTASPAEGSVLDGWTGCDTTSGTSCTVSMTADRSVSASFSPAPPAAPGVKCGARNATIVGSAGADQLEGTKNADVITGLAGNDKIVGLAGNDRVCGGDGNDKLVGGKGRDTLVGQGGDDRLIGGPGKDKAKGGPGHDVRRP
jgi:subtilisin-like proprotein convertase family protein